MRYILAMLCASFAMCDVAHGGMPQGDIAHVKGQMKKFAPVRIEVEPGLLDVRQKAFVDELVKAARCMDEIFLRQVWSGNVELRDKLSAAGEKGAALYDHFIFNAGPYDRIDHNRPFVEGVPPKPAGAAFYPDDMTKEEFAAWVKGHPDERAAFESSLTVIRRRGKGLVAIPYAEEYHDILTRAAGHLRSAASLTDDASLKGYLIGRADAFLSNDYFQSDVDWVRLKDHAIEVVIGPYETYEDNLFGYKAAFEALITRVEPVESQRLAKVIGYIPEIERHLPIADQHKGTGRGLSSPIAVVLEIYTGGYAKWGMRMVAFNLPNDERVKRQEGGKKVIVVKNVQKAKFDKILLPIARMMMRKADLADVNFDPFFAQMLLSEISREIGPAEIVKRGEKTAVSRELKELYATIHECKTTVLGVYNTIYLMEKGLYPKGFEEEMWPTYLAGLFRVIRWGINSAHGGGGAIQFNYIYSRGGFTYDRATGRFGVNKGRILDVVRELAHDILMIEALGDYDAARAFIEKYKVIRPELKSALARLTSIPVDIMPIHAHR